MIHVDFFHVVKKNKAEFLTTWSFDESLSSGLNMSEFNVYENIFSLDRNLFHRTGQKVYHATGSRRYIKEVDLQEKCLHISGKRILPGSARVSVCIVVQ